jgi:hypothetical protein
MTVSAEILEALMKTDHSILETERQRRARQRAMSVAKFSEDYGIGRTKAYEELKSGRLRGRKAGKRTLISQQDADAWLLRLPAVALAKTAT